MFGLGFGEILVLLIVGVVIVGPKRLPSMMRTAGQWIAKMRRMSTDLRAQSGIDDLIRQEGLQAHLNELRSLSRVNVLETFVAPAIVTTAPDRPSPSAVLEAGSPAPTLPPLTPDEPLREREYPVIGCDAYDALPDDMIPYTEPAPEPFSPRRAAGEAAS